MGPLDLCYEHGANNDPLRKTCHWTACAALHRSELPGVASLQAKKITEIHAEAHAELGMVPTSMMANLQALPALQQALPGLRNDEIELFPAFKHSGDCPSPSLRCVQLELKCQP